MAKKRKQKSTAPVTKIIRVPAATKAPVIRVQAPRAAPVRRRRSHRRSGGVGHHVGGLVSNEAVQALVGGALFGFAVKSGIVAKLPEIPLVGRTGTAAILLDYYSRHGGGPLAARAARAAAAIAGYQLGAEGKITGDMMLGDATTPGSLAGDEYGMTE
jgi:hypothetical protein